MDSRLPKLRSRIARKLVLMRIGALSKATPAGPRRSALMTRNGRLCDFRMTGQFMSRFSKNLTAEAEKSGGWRFFGIGSIFSFLRDLSYILVEAVDKDGNLCPLADNEVQFELSGPGTIAGVGNGNPQSLDPFQANHVKLFYGKARFIVKSKSVERGAIQVEAKSNGIENGTAKIECK